MDNIPLIVIALIVVFLTLRSLLNGKRKKFISMYKFNPELASKIAKKHPNLDERQIVVVQEALKDYFLISNIAGKKFIAMPSQVVDDLWHEFILYTKAYQRFCDKAFGRFLHHIPTEGMKDQITATEGIRRTWKYACKLEDINPNYPEKLPRLFLLDRLYEIPDGFYYSKDCKDSSLGTASGYCASHIGNCGSSSDTSSSCGSSNDSSCGSGCGGD